MQRLHLRKNFVVRGLFFLFLYFASFTLAFGQNTCLDSHIFYDMELHKKLEKFIAEWEKEGQQIAQNRGKINIPIVVHIVYQSMEENISEQQIISQIDVLNQDFNRANSNLDKVHPDFKNRIAKVGFHFCLATIDPDGKPTNGITRTATNLTNVFSLNDTWIYYNNEGGKDAWNTSQYLNIWVTKTASGTLGYGSKPGERKAAEDGIIVASTAFGTTGLATAPFDLGRTLTHEVGHYFNLYHTWRDGCEGNDFVQDTPQQNTSYSGCPDINASSCGSLDIVANFMNYSEDACLAMFTHGQAQRMRASLIGARSSLLNANTICAQNNPISNQILIYPNPARYRYCITTPVFIADSIPYRIIDLKGQIKLEGNIGSNTTQHFITHKKGIYFIQFFIGNGETLIRKLVVL